MPRQFQIIEKLTAEESYATPNSFHFSILGSMNTVHGTIDVHCGQFNPDDDGTPFICATVTIDEQSLAKENDPQPSLQEIQKALFQEFDVGEHVHWELGVYKVADGALVMGGPGVM